MLFSRVSSCGAVRAHLLAPGFIKSSAPREENWLGWLALSKKRLLYCRSKGAMYTPDHAVLNPPKSFVAELLLFFKINFIKIKFAQIKIEPF